MLSQDVPEATSQRSRRIFPVGTHQCALLLLAFIPCILLSGTRMNWAFLVPTALTTSLVSTSTQSQLTFQQFLQERQQRKASHGACIFPCITKSKAGAFQPSTNQSQPLLSAEPSMMKSLSRVLTSTQTSQVIVHVASVRQSTSEGKRLQFSSSIMERIRCIVCN